MSPLITKIDHIGIAVRDLGKAMQLFNTAFQLSSKAVEEVKDFKVKICFIPVGEVLVEFLEPTESGSEYDRFIKNKGEALHHIALRVTDIDFVLKRLKNLGVPLLDQEPRAGGAGSRIAFMDPTGTNNILIELVEREGDL